MSGFSNIATFKHGVHPEEFKSFTDKLAIERMPFVEDYILPLGQHIGAPSVPLVKKGQSVKRGQMIANAGGFVSVALHSPVDGKVQAIELAETLTGKMVQSIKIKTDPYSSQLLSSSNPGDYRNMELDEFIKSVQSSGLVGLGGAAFPAHVKFKIPEDKSCKIMILNGCECEPFLTSDHRVMAEYPEDLINGAKILNHFVKAEKIYIGIESNKPDAIAILNKKLENESDWIEVVPLEVKYPQGAEKMLVTAILNKEVPSGKLPLDVEVLVSNVSSIAALSQWFETGKPLIERVVTITGNAIKRPANMMVPIGTSMREVVNYCGGLNTENYRMLLGGPMMGMVQRTLDIPIVKGTSGLLLLTEDNVSTMDEYSCIRCGRCVEACPMFLNPSVLGMQAKKGLWEDMKDNYVMDCFECGSCSFVCPSHIPLVQSFRVAKGILREQKAKKALNNKGNE
ncbi:MAG: electron transport complex subunit RsxC [Bacteroidia bacterium]|nr:electron transport complex subunit RsxC [Bacteroidia bacterium]NNJ54520.1 electron transport complex subunit RsxC [Bacteroidia bacterium]